MVYDIEFIRQNWLVDGVIPYNEKQVVDSFNEVQNIMGQDWLDKLKFNNGIEKTGPLITITVVELGLKLSLLKRGINYISLIRKLKSSAEVEVAKGMAELKAIYFICNDDDVDFELEPDVEREGKAPSIPDFRAKKKNETEWVYVEVKQPDTSEHNLAVKTIIEKIITLFKKHDNFLSVEIMLLHLPNEEELSLIENKCYLLFNQNQKTEIEIENLGLIKVNHNENVIYTPFQYQGFIGKSVTAQMQTITEFSKEGSAVLKKLIACRIAVSDERARRFLIDASEQLSLTSSNLIWIDGKNVPSLNNWASLIEKQFIDKPDLNKKVSGLVTFFSGIGLKNNIASILNSVKLTLNESANYELPNWIKEKLCSDDNESR